MVHVRFVVPLEVGRLTGGNVYDLRLTEALRQAGVQVDLVRASDADLSVVAPGAGFVLIDGLLAGHRPDVVRDCSAGVLVHMPLVWRSPDQAQVERDALRAASVVIATSHWSGKFLREQYAVSAVVVPPGVDPAPIEPASDPPLIVQVATLTKNKNQLAVVHALARLADLPWQARLVGAIDVDPEYVARVRAAVDMAGLGERIEIPGVLPREAAFAGANLLLLPSRVEAYGMVVAEALARGIPAIVSPGGPAEALGRTGRGDLPGHVLAEGGFETFASLPPRPTTAPLETTLRDWLTSSELRGEWAQAALARRTELSRWPAAAVDLVRVLDGSLR